MIKRYFLSMLSLVPLFLVYDLFYFSLHLSFEIFFLMFSVHFAAFGLLNFLGSYFLFKPIAVFLKCGKMTEPIRKRIMHLGLHSACLILILGSVFVLIFILPLLVAPEMYNDTSKNFTMTEMPLLFNLATIPPSLYIFAVFPSFIIYFLIKDFSLDLRWYTFKKYHINFSLGKAKISKTLSYVFIVLVLIPAVLVILELLMAMNTDYSQFTSLNPLQTIIADRYIVLVGMIFAIILIPRSFTKPVYSLLAELKKVEKGDYTSDAAIISGDEIGRLSNGFNDMLKGLRERELIKQTFGKYLSKDMAKVILEEKIELEGELRLATILITDIANYTSISEALSPKEIVGMLNEYFSIIVRIIQKHQGVVNKFIGDSVFAVFNLPLDDKDHALHALRAAIEIEKETLNKKFKGHQLKTRIGINTGVVVAGNIGSPERMEYTVIGDNVNVAARLEQLNKEYESSILLGEKTYQLAKDKFDFRKIGKVQLKGKEKSIMVYGLEKQERTLI